MAEHHQRTIVGVFALTCLIILAVLVALFGGGRTLFANTYDVNIQFPNGVIGVQEGQSVTVSGRRIGQTRAVEFWNIHRLEEGIRVIVAVDKKYDLPASCRVEVATSIMGFGRPAIQILVDNKDDTSKLSRDGKARIIGRMIPMLDQMLPSEMQHTLVRTADNLGDLAAALSPVAANLEKVLEPRSVEHVDLDVMTANLSTVVERFDAALKNLNALLGDTHNVENFKQTLQAMRLMSEKGIEFMVNAGAMSQEGKLLAQEMNGLVRRLKEPADHMSSVLAKLDRSLEAMERGNGTAGLMLNDNRLYEEMVLSVRRLGKMLDDFREVLDMAKKGQLRIKAF